MNFLQAPLNFLLKQSEVSQISAPAGTIISHIGDPCDQLIILQTGQVRVYCLGESGRAITLYHVKAGESCIMTASCILNAHDFPAIAEIEQDAKGLAVPAKQVLQWLKTEPLWQQYIISLLSQRMSSLICLVDALAFSHLDVRLAIWLLEQSEQQQTIHMTHQIIAEELASSREAISRLLKEFEREGLIKLGRGMIDVLNKEKLSQIK